MKIYNTLTRQIDELQPISPEQVSIYTCGLTVYDYAHIGNWFNFVRMDILVRTLKANGLNTKWVMNVTDVGHLVSDDDDGEDKLEKGARREGKTAWEVAEFYTADFVDGMRLLNMLEPDHLIKATEHITEQIELVQNLEAKGYAYVIDDGVYYDTSKFEGYAAFAQLDLSEQQAGARVSFNKQKRNLADFALWKFSPKDRQRDMEWDSPWGKGFPGWHIECSAMSMKYLGDTLDIHSGGIDLIPVHHTNEIAQSEAASGKRFANYWLHGNHVMVNGEKISKSLGNGIRIHDIVDKGISAEAVRLHVLESHYRSQSKFSWESLEAAANRLTVYQAMADLRWQTKADVPEFDYQQASDRILAYMSDDLDTPSTLAYLSQVEKKLSEQLIRTSDTEKFTALLELIDTILGLQLSNRSAISAEQEKLVVERQTARDEKEWVLSDLLRDQLENESLRVRDTANGPIWSRR